MTYLELTGPNKYAAFKAEKVPTVDIVQEQFVPDYLHDSWIQFQNLMNDRFGGDLEDDMPIYPSTSIDALNPSVVLKPFSVQRKLSNDITFEQLLREEGINARVTSSYRANAKTSNGSASHHSNKDNPAIDIVPANGKSFDQLAIELITNPRIMQWFKDNKWGIHSEVTKDQWNAYTTGAHFHIGPDKVAQKGLLAIVKNYNEGKTDIWKYQLS